MNTKGKVIAHGEVKSGISKADKAWKTQIFVIETESQYPKKQAFTVFGVDKTIPNIDDVITVEYDIESREYNGKWYTDARCSSFSGQIQQAAPLAQEPPASNNEPLPF